MTVKIIHHPLPKEDWIQNINEYLAFLQKGAPAYKILGVQVMPEENIAIVTYDDTGA